MSLGDNKDKEGQMFEGGIYLQFRCSGHVYLLTENEVHRILLDEKRAGYQTVLRQPFKNT